MKRRRKPDAKAVALSRIVSDASLRPSARAAAIAQVEAIARQWHLTAREWLGDQQPGAQR